MQKDKLPQIENTLTSINPQVSTSKSPQVPSSIYHQAIRDLKDVHQKINSIKTKINSLTTKHNKARNKTMENNQQQLKKKFYLYEAKQRSRLLQIKQRSQAALRKVFVERKKLQIVKKLDKSKRSATQAKFKTHDMMKEHSLENLKKIQRQKRANQIENQQKHDQLYFKAKNNRHLMENIQQDRQTKMRQFFSIQTKLVQDKILEKKKELVLIEKQCENFERKLKYINEKSSKKIKHAKKLRRKIPTFTKQLSSLSMKNELKPESRINFDTIQ